MAKVTIYTRPFCGYCARALKVLGEKGADRKDHAKDRVQGRTPDAPAAAPKAAAPAPSGAGYGPVMQDKNGVRARQNLATKKWEKV